MDYGTALNVYLITRRYHRVYEATGDVRAANRAAWRLYGIIWLAGWGTVGLAMFGFLCTFWLGFLVPVVLCAACGIGALMLWSYDQKQLHGDGTSLSDPPPIPDELPPIPPAPPVPEHVFLTKQVNVAFYHDPRRMRSADRGIIAPRAIEPPPH